MPNITDQLWELHYDLLSETEAERLRVRIAEEPEIAQTYEEVKRSATQIAKAASKTPDKPLVFSVASLSQERKNGPKSAEFGNEPYDEEKKTVSPPPEVPEEITGSFSTVIDTRTGNSVRLKPHFLVDKTERERPKVVHAHARPRTPWNPFAIRFSSKYLRSNRFLSVCSILLLILTCTGFLQIRQNRLQLTSRLIQINAVAPESLARATQNTLSVAVSDLSGNPKQLPVRVSLLSDSGEKIAVYQEKTNAQGNLQLALENPPSLPESVFLEITAGEKESARTVLRRIPVTDPPPLPALAVAGAVKQTTESGAIAMLHGFSGGRPTESLPEQNRFPQARRPNIAPFYNNAQNALSPGMRGQTRQMGAGMMGGMRGGMDGASGGAGAMGMGGGMSGGMGGMGMSGGMPMKVAEELKKTEQSDAEAVPATLAASGDAFESEVSAEPLTMDIEFLPEEKDETQELPQEPSVVEMKFEQYDFDAAQPIQFQVRSRKSNYPLIVMVSRQGLPVAQIAAKTSKSPEDFSTIIVPENESLTGLLQIALFDPTSLPPQELASDFVFRRASRFLKVEKTETGVKITDEQGLPVAANLRLTWWKGNVPPRKPSVLPLLIDNYNQVQSEWELKVAQQNPVYTEMLGFFTILGIAGGIIVSITIAVLFLLRRVSGYMPLVLAVITGTISILFAVSLTHEQQMLVFPAALTERAGQIPFADLPKSPSDITLLSEDVEQQWFIESDEQGICPFPLFSQTDGPATLQIEAYSDDNRAGFARWTIPF